MEKNYKIVGGTSFDSRTPDVVCNILENFRQNCRRIRIFYGDSQTGKCWMDEFDTMGYVGRSTGSVKIPLLVKNSRSLGGGAIFDHCIVKITDGARVLYQHPKFNMPDISINGASVYFDGVNVANFNDEQKAARWVEFMKGNRNSKN